MSDFQQNPVSKVVWPWLNSGAFEEHAPSKLMAVVGFLIASTIAALFYFIGGHRIGPCIIMSIATLFLIIGLFLPAVYKVVHGWLQIFAFWVGTALSWILLLPFYYLVFPFGRLCQKLAGKDPMKRAFPTDEKTYWEDRPLVTDKKYYTRQG